MRAAGKEKAVDAVMARRLAVFGVHAAAGHDDDVRILADIKVVVNEIVHAAVRHAGGDGERFALRARTDADVQSRLVGFLFDADVFAAAHIGALAVLPDAVRAAEIGLAAGDQTEQLLGRFIHGKPPPVCGRPDRRCPP